jgi:hypothetical protein
VSPAELEGARVRVTRTTGRRTDREPFEGVAYRLPAQPNLLVVEDPDGLPIVIARGAQLRTDLDLAPLA